MRDAEGRYFLALHVGGAVSDKAEGEALFEFFEDLQRVGEELEIEIAFFRITVAEPSCLVFVIYSDSLQGEAHLLGACRLALFEIAFIPPGAFDSGAEFPEGGGPVLNHF